MNRKPTVKEYITAAGALLNHIRQMQPTLIQRNKGCHHCCFLCKYFNECKNDF